MYGDLTKSCGPERGGASKWMNEKDVLRMLLVEIAELQYAYGLPQKRHKTKKKSPALQMPANLNNA
jgi:hypothetical protein